MCENYDLRLSFFPVNTLTVLQPPHFLGPHKTGIQIVSQTQRPIDALSIKFHYQNEVTLTGLVLVTAFPQPIGNPYK